VKVLELFSGTGSLSKVAKERGHDIFTVEINPDFNPDLCKNIMDVTSQEILERFGRPDLIWASPPCTTFSVASICRYWTDGKPKNEKTLEGIALVKKTLQLIRELNPTFWIIENPRGMLRKQEFMPNDFRKTVTYCQYGSHVQKPTDLWNNISAWIPRPVCKPNANCHDHQPRGYASKLKAGVLHLGTQGRKSNYEKVRNPIFRAVVPRDLCLEIVKACEVKVADGTPTTNDGIPPNNKLLGILPTIL